MGLSGRRALTVRYLFRMEKYAYAVPIEQLPRIE